jgi:hypothetical protein
MAKAKQQSFDFFGNYKDTKHGGELAIGKRCSLLNPTNRMLEKIIHEQAIKYGVKIIQEIALNWSHAHIAILVPTRKAYKSFIRTLTARIVRYLSKITKRNLAGFFDLLPFTRVLNRNENPEDLKDYFEDNAQEALGFLKRKPKKKSLRAPAVLPEFGNFAGRSLRTPRHIELEKLFFKPGPAPSSP